MLEYITEKVIQESNTEPNKLHPSPILLSFRLLHSASQYMDHNSLNSVPPSLEALKKVKRIWYLCLSKRLRVGIIRSFPKSVGYASSSLMEVVMRISCRKCHIRDLVFLCTSPLLERLSHLEARSRQSRARKGAHGDLRQFLLGSDPIFLHPSGC